jgi:O-antigen/teichoic acid export membrane protein
LTKLIEKIITVIFKKTPVDSYFSGYLIKNSVQLFLLQSISLGLGFLLNYVFIKLAGVNDYGQYVYTFNFIYLLVNLCMMGTDSLLVKNISVYDASENYRKLKGIIFFGVMTAVAGSLFIAFCSKVIVDLTGIIKNKGNFNWFMLAITSLFMLSVTAVFHASLQGSKKIILSQLAEKIIKPTSMVILVLAVFYVQKEISFNKLILINLAAIGITLIITLIFFQRNIGFKLKDLRPAFEFNTWIYSAGSFFLLGILYILNSRIDIFLLGLLKGSAEVGVYNIGLKISETISFGLVIVNFVLAPVIAKLFASGEMFQLQQIVTRAAQMVFLFSFPLVLLIFLFGQNVLAFFGVDFLNGNKALIILCFGQIINILCGSVGTLLMMTGHQRFSLYSLGISTVFNIVVNIILTPAYGVVGTAFATAGSLAIWNLLMYWFVRKKIKIYPAAFKIF